MPLETVSAHRAVREGRAHHPTSVEDTLRSLISTLERAAGPEEPAVAGRAAEAAEELVVVYQMEIEGVRYSLMRHRAPEAGLSTVSPRELAVARLIAQGLSNKCIGDILEISQWTVAAHLRRIFLKLGVNSRAAMVARLSTEGLL